MREFDRLRAAQYLPRPEVEARSRKSLTALLRWACAEVPYYREFCGRAGLDPSRVGADDLPAFPLMAKRELMDRQERFLASGRVTPDCLSTSTGGSTGVVFRFYVDKSARHLRTANALLGETWAGWRPGDKQALLWGHPQESERIRSIKDRAMAAFVHRSLNLNAFDLDEAATAAFAARLRSWRPVLIRGYASALAFLSEYLSRNGIRVDPPRGIISTAETLTDEYRESVERYFGCPVLNRYGSREFANIAQQCDQVGGMHVFIDRLHVEIVRPDGTPCEPGERGEIVVTSFDNRAMPFIRYRTGDIARSQEGSCACGRGFPLLAAVEGRTSELIVGKNGKYYSCPGPRFYGGEIPGIGQMQLVQDTIEEIEVRIVPTPEWTGESSARLEARMRDLLGDIRVKIVPVDKIPPSPSGKYPFAISKVSPFNT